MSYFSKLKKKRERKKLNVLHLTPAFSFPTACLLLHVGSHSWKFTEPSFCHKKMSPDELAKVISAPKDGTEDVSEVALN